MEKLFLFSFLILTFTSCHNSGEQPIIVEKYDTVHKTITLDPPTINYKRRFENYDLDSLIVQVKTKGDKKAFQKVYVYYAERTSDSEILDLTFLMANKYKYNYANFLIYCIFVEQHNNQLKNLDAKSQNLALYYLARAHELGYTDAKDELENTAEKNTILQKSAYYLDKMKEQN